MMPIIVILLVGEILFRFFDAEQDTIMFRTPQSWFPKWRWYIENNWGTKNWWLKVPFSMLLDGWHFIKFCAQMVRIVSPVTLAIMLLGFPLWFIPIAVIALYGIGGIVFELTYGSKI
jgi:hypothetical protein